MTIRIKKAPIVDGLFPANRVHILGGPSGSGKTTWLLQMLHAWQQGEDVLKHKSYPVPVAYISADRDVDDIYERMESLGIPLDSFPVIAGTDVRMQAETLPDLAPPGTRLLIIEGVARFVPDGRQTDYNVVAEFLLKLGQVAKVRDITIIGTVHTAKVKANDRYARPRERILGSVAWGAYSSTVMIIEPVNSSDVRDRSRVLLIQTRTGNDDEINLELTQAGRLIEAASPTEQTRELSYFASMDIGVEYARAQLVETASKMFGISDATADRMLKKLVDEQRLVRLKGGMYVRPLPPQLAS